ncbi:sugar phosphate isomerase/epimerase family protein [Aestuariimicrobium ganziense]|uniref:sugar phosphate isomerase/epimerase family protein n=1 Tax=Aestuariimicrobium ganziense TaxID=2773677 RepID=UPI0019448B86|nr:sugar phosphate isomerase/epimerase family protein [Aestuariimicrobium ganziense]
MRVGFSSYSFHSLTSSGQMTIPEVIDWVADSDAEHLELAVGFANDDPMSDLSDLPNNRRLVDAIKARVAATGITLSQMAMPASFWTPEGASAVSAPGQGEQTGTAEALEAEVARVKAHLDLCEELGITLLRHDVSHGNHPGDDSILFEQALPVIAEQSKTIAQYAAGKGVRTSIENHGFFVQASERVRRVIHAVDEQNFGTTLDVGNFLCVDEDPVVAVGNNIAYATIVHFKDFYIRKQDPGSGFFRSRGGKYLRGAVVGQGDIDMVSVAEVVKTSGYDGFVTIEFEGSEPALTGCTWGLENTRRLLGQA